MLARGHAPGAWFDPHDEGPLGRSHPELAPVAGKIAWRIRDAEAAADDDHALPAKLIVRATGDGTDPDWGDDATDGAARNYVYTVDDGAVAIPPGSYRVSIHRGPEYSAVERRIVVKADETVKVQAELRRVVDTRGWISADLHVHAIPSWDAPTRLTDRVRSLCAVNVEVAVATDHNAVTDYRPTIEELGVERWMTSVVGDEVTTDHPLFGHFNVFPLTPGGPPVHYDAIAPKDLFAAARRASPHGVVQVNHPRMGDIGYFELLRMDREAVGAWKKRTQLADTSFDAIEVFNGDHYADVPEVEWVMQDWYALLDAGFHHAGTGNSDSHKVAYQEAGIHATGSPSAATIPPASIRRRSTTPSGAPT